MGIPHNDALRSTFIECRCLLIRAIVITEILASRFLEQSAQIRNITKNTSVTSNQYLKILWVDA